MNTLFEIWVAGVIFFFFWDLQASVVTTLSPKQLGKIVVVTLAWPLTVLAAIILVLAIIIFHFLIAIGIYRP